MTKPAPKSAPQKPAKAPAKPAEYVVQADGWVAGARAKKGARLTLSAAAAKYENVQPA